ncbi:MAG: hypothetical protein NTX59_13575 [Elusimicrobia bacterium]|nr:hypothetical protein [Elusimicrobiota bacterium]
MTLNKLVKIASNKENFKDLKNYVEFCEAFMDFVGTPSNIQAEIVSRNETHYRFLQFKNETFSVTRPLNYDLLYTGKTAKQQLIQFLKVLDGVKGMDTPMNREVVNRAVYTIQQSIGASLDALPAGLSNKARKINGDLFERLIRLILVRVGIDCTSGVVSVPVKMKDGDADFIMSYQHDLIIKSGALVKIIGSVKTSSKDRLDKIFVDKFLLARLTGKNVPHIAIFLNDVQRKGKTPKEYGVNATFLPGHFKGYTIKLNPLDGVYYFDIRPNMLTEKILKDHIRTFDHFLFKDLWTLLNKTAIVAQIKPVGK